RFRRSLFPNFIADPPAHHSFPTRRSSDLTGRSWSRRTLQNLPLHASSESDTAHVASPRTRHQPPSSHRHSRPAASPPPRTPAHRSEEHTSELQSRENLVCRLLLEKKTTPQ